MEKEFNRSNVRAISQKVQEVLSDFFKSGDYEFLINGGNFSADKVKLNLEIRMKNSDGTIADQNVFPEQLINNSEQLKYIFRLILILDSQHEPDEDMRLDKAFRRFGADEADLQLFDAYVLGGVEVLYEKLIDGSTDPAEYINRMYDFVEEFNERFNEGITNKDILDLCRDNVK